MQQPSAPLDLRQLEKVDLHRHIEGSIRPATALELGQSAGVFPSDMTLAELERRIVIDAPVDLFDALDRFDLLRKPVIGYEALVRIARECIEDGALDRVITANLRFSPSTLARSADLEPIEVFRAVDEGIQLAKTDYPDVMVERVVIISRRRGLDAAWGVVRQLEGKAGQLVDGVDFAADEQRHRTAEFADVASALDALGLPLTVHTGEGIDASAVAEALALPGVRRLGHALSLIDDPALVREVIDRGIVIESCPTSNVRTRTVPSLAEHPARAMREAGIRICLCTDDPALFALDLTHELALARSVLGFTNDDLRASQRWGRAAFFGP